MGYLIISWFIIFPMKLRAEIESNHHFQTQKKHYIFFVKLA